MAMGDKSPRSKDKNNKQKQTATKKSNDAMAKKQAAPLTSIKGVKK